MIPSVLGNMARAAEAADPGVLKTEVDIRESLVADRNAAEAKQRAAEDRVIEVERALASLQAEAAEWAPSLAARDAAVAEAAQLNTTITALRAESADKDDRIKRLGARVTELSDANRALEASVAEKDSMIATLTEPPQDKAEKEPSDDATATKGSKKKGG